MVEAYEYYFSGMGLDRIAYRRELVFPEQNLTLGSYDGRVELRRKVNVDSEKIIAEMRREGITAYNGKVDKQHHSKILKMDEAQASKILEEILGKEKPLENILSENCSIKPCA